MRIMALDLGEKNIGVAVSDPTGLIARGVEVIRRTTREKDLARLKELVEELEVGQVIVGLPLNMNGSEGPEAEKARESGREIAGFLQVPLLFWDERLTTLLAEKVLLQADLSRARRKKVIDKMAAVFILQNFLDKEKNKEKNIKEP